MLQRTVCLRKVHSHQLVRSTHPNAGTRYGRVYTRGFIRYGFGGFGMSVYTPRKNRNFRIEPVQDTAPNPHAEDRGLSPTTRTLSPNFRAFALQDGGVLVSHPSHAQVMQWGQRVHNAETAASGTTSMDNYVNSRIQAIIADNTIENTSLQQWRKAHMWQLIKSHARLQRHWGTPDFVQGAQSTLYRK